MAVSNSTPHINIPPCSMLTWQNYLKISLAFYTQLALDVVVSIQTRRNYVIFHPLHVHSLL
jgi:hypothetical protein